MSITSAMFTGVSGLLANAEGINVIGNNLANVNTIGFKDGRMLFSDMLSANIGNDSQIGKGTQIQKVDNLFSQGSFETTTSTTDLAIQGSSFFAVKDPNAASPVNQNAALLTRAGAFRLDSNSFLINPDGYQVLDTAGNPIKFSDNAAGIAAANNAITAATTAATTVANADPATGAYLTAYTTASAAIDAQAALYDVGGVNDAAALEAAVNALPGVTAPDQAAATAITTAAAAAKTASAAAVLNPTAANVAAAQTAFTALTTLTNGTAFTTPGAPALLAAFQTPLNTSNTAVSTAVTTMTATVDATIAADPAVVAANTLLATANGLAFGKISSINSSGLITYLGKDGLTLNYYNGSGQVGVAANAATVQRLAVVTVTNPDGLEKAGGTLFKPTTASGISSAAFTLATNSANGSSEKILSNNLEQSTVDMAAQFVKMILTQRAYSANSKTITTADEMTQEVLALKR